MELRVLRYFLAVAREESISDAADFLHITPANLIAPADGFRRRTWQTAFNPR